MAIGYRDTRARFRDRARFMGLDTTPLPVLAAGMAGLVLLTLSYAADAGWPLAVRLAVCGSPFFGTVGYLWAFRTNRRPYFDRDLFCLLINGRSESPRPPQYQPLSPFRPKGARGSRKDWIVQPKMQGEGVRNQP